MRVFVIDDDKIMAECLARAARKAAAAPEVQVFRDGFAAMGAIADGELPDLIFLDVLLDGPDGFTLLNELMSYTDTAKIPVVLVSALPFNPHAVENYGVVGYLSKDTMRPEEVQAYVQQYAA